VSALFPFPGFDLGPVNAFLSRFLKGPEQAMAAYRELLGLEAGSRERAVDLVAQLARNLGVDGASFFEGILRLAPLPTARIAAAAYLAEQGREDIVLDVLESLAPPVLGMTLLRGMLEAIARRPVSEATVARLLDFGRRFEDDRPYSTLYPGSDFTGRDVKRAVRRALAEGLLRRHAAGAEDWPRDPAPPGA
jgi:hypothetical protein